MEKNLFTSSSKKLAYGFLIAVLLILAFEFANQYFDNYFYSINVKGIETPFEGLRLKVKNEVAQSAESNFDVLILGDSHGQVSIIPRIIEEKTGLSCFNFSTFGLQGTMGSYWLFKNYLKTHPVKPKYVIFGYSMFLSSLYRSELLPENALTNFSNLKRGNVLAYIEEYGLVQGIKFILPSLKHQGRFKELIKNPFSFKMPDKSQLNNFIKQVYLEKGYYPEMVEKSFSPESRESGYKQFFSYIDVNNFVISPFVLKYLKKNLDLAESNNIKIIYYVQAVPPYLYDAINKYDYLKQYDDFIDSLKKDYPDIIVIKPQNMLNKNDMYLDTYHLNGKGAPVLSDFLAQRINELQQNHN